MLWLYVHITFVSFSIISSMLTSPFCETLLSMWVSHSHSSLFFSLNTAHSFSLSLTCCRRRHSYRKHRQRSIKPSVHWRKWIKEELVKWWEKWYMCWWAEKKKEFVRQTGKMWWTFSWSFLIKRHQGKEAHYHCNALYCPAISNKKLLSTSIK